MKTILFLCSGNSCRSQMAEAIVNARYSDRWRVFSAGTKPSGFVHPKAITVLAEIDITHAGTSKHTDELDTKDFDLVGNGLRFGGGGMSCVAGEGRKTPPSLFCGS